MLKLTIDIFLQYNAVYFFTTASSMIISYVFFIRFSPRSLITEYYWVKTNCFVKV